MLPHTDSKEITTEHCLSFFCIDLFCACLKFRSTTTITVCTVTQFVIVWIFNVLFLLNTLSNVIIIPLSILYTFLFTLQLYILYILHTVLSCKLNQHSESNFNQLRTHEPDYFTCKPFRDTFHYDFQSYLSNFKSKWCMLLKERFSYAIVKALARDMYHMYKQEKQFMNRLNKSYGYIDNFRQVSDNLIRYVFHEVRIPLTNFMLATQELKDLESDFRYLKHGPTFIDLLSIIDDQSKRMRRIVDDILTFKKLQHQGYKGYIVEIKNELFSFEHFVSKTIKNVQQSICTNKRLRIVVEYTYRLKDRYIHQVQGDEKRLQQVLENLLSNAVKASDERKIIHIHIEIQPYNNNNNNNNNENIDTFIHHNNNENNIKHHNINIQSYNFIESSFFNPLVNTEQVKDILNNRQHMGNIIQKNTELNNAGNNNNNDTNTTINFPQQFLFVIRIRDYGKGIAKEHEHKLFKPFEQILSSKDQEIAGSGLGLSIANEIMKLQKGKLEFQQPTDGRGGAIFVMKFPLQVEKIDACNDIDNNNNNINQNYNLDTNVINITSIDVVPPSECTDKALCQMIPLMPITDCIANILIVEDNVINQKLISRQLTNAKFQVYTACDGQEAIEMLQKMLDDMYCRKSSKFPLDIILMDGNMPVMDGYTATQKIRKDLKLEIPILAVTGNLESTDQEKFKDCGANDILSKPYALKELIHKIKQLVGIK